MDNAMRKFHALLPLAFLMSFGAALAQDVELMPPPHSTR